MGNKLKGLMNDADDSILNDRSLNTSYVGEHGHRRQYSEEHSVLFGKDLANDTFTGELPKGESENVAKNIFNLNNLIDETEEDNEAFDPKKFEEEFKKKLEKQEKEKNQNSSRNVWGLRNDTGSEYEASIEKPQPQPEENEYYNPFKSPVVPEVVSTPSNSDSHKDSSKSQKEESKAVSVPSHLSILTIQIYSKNSSNQAKVMII